MSGMEMLVLRKNLVHDCVAVHKFENIVWIFTDCPTLLPIITSSYTAVSLFAGMNQSGFKKKGFHDWKETYQVLITDIYFGDLTVLNITVIT